jgi:hypothetical protein
MLHASLRDGRLGRFPALVLVLFLGGLLVLTPRGAAEDAKTAPKDAPKAPAKEAPKTTEAPKGPTFRVHKDAKPDVPEMVTLINSKIEEKWKENNVTPSVFVDDYEFIRRASLDIVGRIATRAEIDEYFKDSKETRRSLLIDRLLSSQDFPRHWANLWTNWLLSRAGVFGRGTYHEQTATWLEDQFATNAPYDKIVRELISAQGKNTENGAVNFILAHTGEMVPPGKRSEEGQFEMVPLTSRITRLFLGTQVQCSQCHDHPFYANLKQNHFWGVNAFLRQVQREGTPPMEGARRMMTYPALTLRDNKSWNSEAIVFFEKRNGVVLQTKAEFLPSADAKRGPRLSSEALNDERPNARRVELANYVTNHDSFPRALVNRVWSIFFGRGFVNPIDDFNDQNQPSHPELLTEMSARVKHYNYDLKKLIRWICNSNAYNLSYVANKTNEKQEHEVLFSRMLLKSMSPEQLFESLWVATEPKGSADRKKTQKEKWLGNLVSNFGDDEGNEVNFNGTVVQALMMMNGQDINEAISDKKDGTVALVMARNRVPATLINDVYLIALNRLPTPLEKKNLMDRLPLRPQYRALDAKNPAGPYQDLFWALLNSNEFLLNH